MKKNLAMKLKALTDLHDALTHMPNTDEDKESYSDYANKFNGTDESPTNTDSTSSDSIFKKLKKAKKP